jgi:uncharacterized membrane protein
MKTYLILILIMATIDAIVFTAIKENRNFVPYGMIIYSIQPLLFYYSLKYNNSITVSNIMWDLTSDILVTFVGIFILREYLSTKQLIGLVLGFIAIILLNK